MNIEKRRFQQNPEVIDTVLDKDEATLMHLGTKLSYALNQTGLRIWCLLKEGCTTHEIVERLYEEFDVEREQARKGVINFIEELLSFKLILEKEGLP